MTLAAGTKLGRYEIRSKLGEGGMGEVYLATDTQLRRRVAIKILSPQAAAREDRMRRFIQEAQSAAALNHPNIAHVYEIGETDGVHFIAMEFIEGLTLREGIHKSRIELRKLLRYLQQVAEGLAKAHAAGIAHRDLKPDNVMITNDGFAKILDFGLAKLIEPQRHFGSGSLSEDVPTAIMNNPSVAGSILGTVGYMSPEQVRGKSAEIDHRSDIFSFGCILFEAATRHRAFRGEDEIDTLHKIVHGPTPKVRESNPLAPDQLERIVKRCLAKDPDKRYQAIKDIAIELEELQQDIEVPGVSDSFASIPSAAQPSSTSSRGPSRWPDSYIGSTATGIPSTSSAEYLFGQIKQHKAATVLVAGGFLVSVAALVFLLSLVVGRPDSNEKPRSNSARPASEMKISRLTGSGKVQTAAISPDGKFLAYVELDGESQSLWAKQILTNSTLQLVPAAPITYFNVTFTPDGNYIYYTATGERAEVMSVFRVPTLGGTATRVLEDGGRGISFSSDGGEFVFENYDSHAGQSSLMIANADGSTKRKLASLSAHEWFAEKGPAWSPDRKLIACATGDDRHDRQMTMSVVSVADGRVRNITGQRWDAIGQAVWLADGSAIVFSASDSGTASAKQIWKISYPGGDAGRVTRDLNSYLDLSITADSKTLVASQHDRTASIWVSPDASLDRAIQVTTGHNDGGNGLAWAGGDRIVYVSIASGNTEIWIMNADGSGQKQLTNDSYLKYAPAVTPNGRYVVFVSQSAGIHLWRVDWDGSNLLQLTNGNFDNNPSMSPDGQWVVFSSYLSGKLLLWRVPIGGGEPAKVTEVFATAPDVSPDGKLIACFANDTTGKKPAIMILPFAGGTPVKILPLAPTANWDAGLRWTPDGRALTYVDRRGTTMNLWSQPLGGGPPRQLTTFNEGGIERHEWSSDGSRVAVVRGLARSDAVILSNFH